MNKKIKTAVAAAMMGAESDVAPPSRARSSSFASMVLDLNVGDQPASRVVQMEEADSIAWTMGTLKEQRDKLRNTVTSAVSQAKRRNPGAEYSIEVGDFMLISGIYVVAMVRRIA